MWFGWGNAHRQPAKGHYLGVSRCSPCSPSHKESDMDPAAEMMPPLQLYHRSFPRVRVGLCLLHLCETDLNLPGTSCHGAPILKDLDHLCILVLLQVPLHVTSRETIRPPNYRSINRKQLFVATVHKTIPFYRGSHAFASPLRLLSLSFAPEQVELIYNHLCLQNGHVNKVIITEQLDLVL